MDAIDLRAVAVLVSASICFTALSPAIYRRDPGRRKLFLVGLAAVLLVAPWWSAAGLWTWPVGVEKPAGWLAQPLPRALAVLWWTVALIGATRSLARIAAGRRRLAALPALAEPGLERELHAIARSLGLTRSVSLRRGPTPCASTLGRPLLVLPPAAEHWDAATRRAVLGHELAHIRRNDDRWLLLVRLLIDWYWWMPWLKRLQRRYVEAMEESCDDAASHLIGDRTHYVEGLVAAVRSLPAGTRDWDGWVALLGHSHLTARAERLLTRPRPTLDQADGRWVLGWSSIVLAILLTARPAAVPDRVQADTTLYPLQQTQPQSALSTPSRIEARSYLEDWRRGGWHPLPDSARHPLPVYPAGALAAGVTGTVTVEIDLGRGPSGWYRRSPPRVFSSDPGGLLEAAVHRALARAGSADLAASVRPVGT